MLKVVKRIGIGLMLALLFIAFLADMGQAARPFQTAPNSLYVNGALIDLQNATPGQVYEHEMTVGIGPEAPAMDVRIDARGFGQDIEGAFIPLMAEQDVSPYSARTYISQITPQAFRLEPGASVPVKVTLTLPQDLGNASRYALLFIDTNPDEQTGQVSQILTASIPVVVIPAAEQPDWSGEISDVSVPPVISGQPIEILTTVKNSGNHHYKVQGLITILDPAGQLVADIPIQNTAVSILPTFSQQIRTTYAALDRSNGLPAGTYTVLVSMAREDGTQLDDERAKFEIRETFLPFPGIDPDSLVIRCYEDEIPGTINALAKADVSITFENMVKGTGCVAIGKYVQEPDISPSFSSPTAEGGMEATGVKFVAVQVDGFKRGIAHITVRYLPEEVNGVNVNSLLLAYRDTSSWHKLENLILQTGAEVVIGDLQVAMLNEGKEIALGGESSGQTVGLPIPLAWIASTGAVMIVITAGIFYWRSRRNHINNDQE